MYYSEYSVFNTALGSATLQGLGLLALISFLILRGSPQLHIIVIISSIFNVFALITVSAIYIINYNQSDTAISAIEETATGLKHLNSQYNFNIGANVTNTVVKPFSSGKPIGPIDTQVLINNNYVGYTVKPLTHSFSPTALILLKIILREIFRVLLCFVMSKVELICKRKGQVLHLCVLPCVTVAIAMGIGFSLVEILTVLGSTLDALLRISSQTSELYATYSCRTYPLALLQAYQSNMVLLMNIFSMIIIFRAFHALHMHAFRNKMSFIELLHDIKRKLIDFISKSINRKTFDYNPADINLSNLNSSLNYVSNVVTNDTVKESEEVSKTENEPKTEDTSKTENVLTSNSVLKNNKESIKSKPTSKKNSYQIYIKKRSEFIIKACQAMKVRYNNLKLTDRMWTGQGFSPVYHLLMFSISILLNICFHCLMILNTNGDFTTPYAPVNKTNLLSSSSESRAIIISMSTASQGKTDLAVYSDQSLNSFNPSTHVSVIGTSTCASSIYIQLIFVAIQFVLCIISVIYPHHKKFNFKFIKPF